MKGHCSDNNSEIKRSTVAVFFAEVAAYLYETVHFEFISEINRKRIFIGVEYEL